MAGRLDVGPDADRHPDRPGHQLEPFPRERHNIIDALTVGATRHMFHALLELDVTRPRRLIREHKAATGESLSFTAFIVRCLGCAVDCNKRLHAYRDWRNRLVLFDEVDTATLIESEVDAVAIPHVIRATNRRTVRDIHDEIRQIQSNPRRSEQQTGWLVRLSPFVPGFVRRTFLRILGRSPYWLKRSSGTTLVSAVGMFGAGAGFAVGIVPLHTLSLLLAGISEKPIVVDGRIEPREILAVTLSVDHDIVDGAPAARFVRSLRELIEGAAGLEEAIHPPPSPPPSTPP
jgi:hypothetical protein